MKKTILILIIGFLLNSCASSESSSNSKLGKIWPKEKFGSIENRNILNSLLSTSSNKAIDSTKPLIVIYYPGKDRCNSSGSSTRESTEAWYNEMEKGINKISESNIFYIYKDTIGLYGRNDGYKDWFKDPEKTFEMLFFKENPVCSGYVLISKDGDFISNSSEFDKKFLWKRLKYLMK